MSTNEYQGRPVALVCGVANSLGQAVAEELGSRSIRLYLADHESRAQELPAVAETARASGAEVVGTSTYTAADPAGPVLSAVRAAHRIDHYVELCVPTEQWTVEDLGAQPLQCLRRGLAAMAILVASPENGSAVLQTFLPSMYADSHLDVAMPMLKGAITGVTRTLCRRFGPAGATVNCLQTGLLDMPETKALAKERVLSAKLPVGRWASASDAAKMIAFLLTTKGYYTGQSLVFDGGLTAGITGT